MKNEKKKTNVALIIEIVLLSLFVLGFCFLIAMQIISPEAEVSIWMKENILDIENVGKSIISHI